MAHESELQVDTGRATRSTRSTRSAPARSSAAAIATTDRVYAGYFVAQAVVGVVLWIAAALSSTVRSWLELIPERHDVTQAFLFPDMGVIVVGSALSAWAILTRARSAPVWAAFTAGGVLYPTIYLFGFVASTGGGAAAALAIMVPPSTLTCWVAYQVYRSGR